MQIRLILSPNYLLNVPAPSHSDDCAAAVPGKGNILMNGANEEGGEVS